MAIVTQRNWQSNLFGARAVTPVVSGSKIAGTKQTYGQDWHNYREARKHEKEAFQDILSDLCSYIPSPKISRVGRPQADVSEMVFSCVSKVYEQLSSDRCTSDLEIARRMGHLSHTPHPNTVLKYFNEPFLTPILTDLIRLSSLPLKDFEDVFAVDASGLSSAFYSRWFDYRFNKIKGIEGRAHSWLKIHVMCGVKTNIVTSIIVTDGKIADSPMFPKLVKDTAKHFRIAEVSADKGYTSISNYNAVKEVGGTAYIPFKSNTTATVRSGSKGRLFRKMFHYSQLHGDEFLKHYHKRSNVETVFSALKRKFQGKLMMKGEVGQVNEALAKVLCHNICVLNTEVYEGNAKLGFEPLAHLLSSYHINSDQQDKEA